MNVLTTSGWNDYELLDSGNGYRLERFGRYVLVRPDPQAIWKKRLAEADWDRADAIFKDEKWEVRGQMPKSWLLHYDGLSFFAKLTPFKHTGVFPEQSVQWKWIGEKIKNQSFDFAQDKNAKIKNNC